MYYSSRFFFVYLEQSPTPRWKMLARVPTHCSSFALINGGAMFEPENGQLTDVHFMEFRGIIYIIYTLSNKMEVL